MKSHTFKFVSITLIFLILVAFMAGFSNKNNLLEFHDEDDMVPDSITAKKIAEAIWLPIFGNSIYECTPYKASLKFDRWIVEGTLKDSLVGGVPYISINKKDCRIISVWHTR